jgi:membrane-bound metal-dependent hydrolase YbcI (DUF457 family)
LDNVTHTLFGATLGRAVFARAGRGTTAALVLASNLPDADIVMTAGGPLNYLAWHRGPTHGPLGVIVLGLATAAIVWGWQRRFDRHSQAEHASFPALLLASLIGLVGHVLMDLPTSYGTRLLSPFDWHWYAIDLMPIVDVYLLMALVAGLMIGLRVPTLRRRMAVAALIVMACDYGLRASMHRRAVSVAQETMAPVLAPHCDETVSASPLDRWPRDGAAAHRAQAATPCLVEIAAIPTFLSPFRWQAIARLTDGYRTLDLDLLARGSAGRTGAAWHEAVHYPDQWTPAVDRAADTPLGHVFLDFSRFPATSATLHPDRSSTVSWTDLRFVAAPIPRSQTRRSMFTALVTLAPDGTVLKQRLGQ